jgi:putative DNA primase/helicase
MSDDSAQRIAALVEEAVSVAAPGDTQPEADIDPFQHDGDAGPGEDGPPPNDADPEVIAANAGLDQNDTDNGKRLLRLFGDRFLNVREIGLHAWEGRFWQLEGGDHEVERCAQDTARMMKLEALWIFPPPAQQAKIGRAKSLRQRDEGTLSPAELLEIEEGEEAADALRKRREGRHKFAISCGNRARTLAMIAQALPHRTISPAALDSDPMRFNVENGTLVFERQEAREIDPECPDPEGERWATVIAATARLEAHSPEHRISKMSRVTYDPKARSPLWDAFMQRFQPDEEQRRFLQIAAGRSLIGGASTQVLIFLYGDGANGKSVFMETLAQLCGDYAGRLKPESITGSMEQSGDKASPDFARLQGKRFVAIAELPRGAPMREGLVKTMTGSEPMPVRHLNKGFFDMVPEFIPFMSGNQMPEIGGLDKGIWRRLKFVKWPVTLADEEQRPLPKVVSEFMAEGAGILNWLIEGALIFLREGLKDPPAVRDLTQSHREDSDPVGAFIGACVVPRPGDMVPAREMYGGFARWCEANAIKPWGEKTFSLALKQKGLVREDKRYRTRMWLEIGLENVPENPQPADYGGRFGR